MEKEIDSKKYERIYAKVYEKQFFEELYKNEVFE